MSFDMSDAPLACDLGALDPASRARHADVTQQLWAQVRGVEELSNGYSLRLPATDAALLLAAEFITRERRCCPFFEFNLSASAEAACLSLTGAGGVKAFLAAEILSGRGGDPHA
jgi:hypothetical protein